MARVTDDIPDPKNANLGTERGRGMLGHSLRAYGAGRSILVDQDNVTSGCNCRAARGYA